MNTTVPAPTISVRPVVLPAPGRGEDLQVRVTAPVGGDHLPVLLFSHGYGQSMDAYAPLVDHWSAAGFVVLTPTHLDSRTLRVTPDDPRHPELWRHRVDDLVLVLDRLADLVAAVPGLTGRVDPGRIAVAGHSWGAQSVGVLLGARVLDAHGVPGEDRTDARVRAGVLLAATGTGEDLTPFAAENLPFLHPDFSGLTTRTLVVAGDADDSALSTRGPDWFTDAFHRSPGATDLLTMTGGEHSLGGISGYTVTETTDEDPDRVDLVRRVTTAFLRDALGVDGSGWTELTAADHPLGRLTTT